MSRPAASDDLWTEPRLERDRALCWGRKAAAVAALTAWASFYVITGSSAGALIGLTFVVLTLIRASPLRANATTLGAFSTPTVVHFSLVLLVSATLSAPWPELPPVALVLGVTGLGGLAYTLIVVRRLRRARETYVPVFEDWLTHAALPLVAYTVLIVAAILLPGNHLPALFGIAATMLLLLFVGIHNAWDTVTFIAIVRPQQQEEEKKE